MPPISESGSTSNLRVMSIFQKRTLSEKIVFVIAVVGLIVFFIFYNISAPNNYPSKSTVFVIAKGDSIIDVANTLEDIGVIRSPIIFRVMYAIFGGKTIQAGSYRLGPSRLSAISIVRGIANQSLKGSYTKLVFPEGFTVHEIAKVIKRALPDFDEAGFVTITSYYEGYLFPDTYFAEEGLTPKAALDLMLNNFETKTKDVLTKNEFKVASSTIKKADVVTIASLLEEEGKDYESRRMIAGILYRRLEANMALQVDASFIYVNGKKSNITLSDIEIDSPFNSYKYRGLPPHPIANPGLESIKAALNPIATPYLYYLSDLKGNLYYAKTFEEHKVNREKYLGK